MITTEPIPEVVDIGVNLAHRSFHADRDRVVQRAFAAGVRTMVITGTSVTGSEEGVRIAREYPPRIFATAGVHPHDSRHCTQGTIPELRRLWGLISRRAQGSRSTGSTF
jgi:TatD DNase family protein